MMRREMKISEESGRRKQSSDQDQPGRRDTSYYGVTAIVPTGLPKHTMAAAYGREIQGRMCSYLAGYSAMASLRTRPPALMPGHCRRFLAKSGMTMGESDDSGWVSYGFFGASITSLTGRIDFTCPRLSIRNNSGKSCPKRGL